jgi:hypothetical protein
MSVVVMLLLAVVVMAAIGLLVAMFVKDKPFYGALSIFVLSGPATVLAFVYLTVA